MKTKIFTFFATLISLSAFSQSADDAARAAFVKRYGLDLRRTQPAQPQQAQAAAPSAQQEALLRQQQEALLQQRQEITNQVYLRYPQPISPDNRIVGGKLYNVKNLALWKHKEGECEQVAADGIVVQQFRIEIERVYGPRKSSSWERQGLVVGGYGSPRTVVSSKETKVPSQKFFLRNFPDMRTVAEGRQVSASAMLAETMDVAGHRLECWDCGLPDTAKNRKEAGIPISTPEQIAAAQEEIAAGIKAIGDKWRAAQQQAVEAANAKRQAADATLLKWDMEQAERGDPSGLLRMGLRYRDGQGVQKDLAKAREYFTKAKQAGSSQGEAELSRLDRASTNAPAGK